MSKPLLSADPVYQKIQQYYDANGSKIDIKQLFDSDPKRFEKYSLTLKTPSDGDILLVKLQQFKLTLIASFSRKYFFSSGFFKESRH